MKKNTSFLKSARFLSLASAAIALLSAEVATATPYASSLTNSGTALSFRLNESADNVRVVYNGGTSSLDLGARAAGLVTTNVAIIGTYQIEVSKTNAAGYVDGAALQISVDATNTLRFINPRGVAVNTDPASPYFGRIYVANGLAGTTPAPARAVGDGLYVMNADYSDAVGQGNTALTGGIGSFNTTDTAGNSPWRLEVGQDSRLYISSFSTNSGNIYVTDANVSNGSGTNVLVGFGTTGSPNHGRIASSVIATGSLANNDLTLFALDSDVGINRIHRWDVGSGPLPVDLAPTNLNNAALLSVAGVSVDMAKGPDGKFYLLQNRADGNEGGLFVIDPTVDVQDDFFSGTPDGLWDVVYDSRADSIGNFGETVDILRQSRAVKISPDGKYMAIIRDSSDTWIIPLVNGIPNLAARRLVPTGSVSTGRDIAFDAAGNLYVLTSGHAVLRVFSPGYKTFAVTGSTGTFTVQNTLPDTTVDITAADNIASEPGSDTGTVTFTRSGSTAAPLTVFYTLSGTATRGVDWATNGISSTTSASVTIPAGQSSASVTVTPLDDAANEPTETVVFTLTPSTNYLTGATSATVSISDDGDLPAVSVVPRGSGSYELLPGRPAKFTVSVLNPVLSDLTVNFTLGGSAVADVDYTSPISSVVIPAGGSNAIVRIAPIDNSTIAANKTIVLNISTDASYVLGTSPSATNILRNDDLASAPIIFSDDFNTNSQPIWTVKSVNADNDAVFAYDYANDGVPAAPHSSGSTLGLRLRSHLAAGPATGISVSPTGKSFAGDYRVRFDLWINYNGPLPAGGSGSSEYFTTGLGVSETRTNVTGITGGSPGSSVVFAVDGDGGFAEATGDFIVYSNNVSVAATTNIFPAGARDNFHAYYAEFGELTATPEQLAGFPNQTGVSPIGSVAMAWHDVVITKQGTNFTWEIDGLRIANIGYSAALIGNNISLGFQDINTSFTDNPQMSMALVDNLRVESLTVQAPFITGVKLINGGADVEISFTGDANDSASAFTLRSAGSVEGTFADVSAAITSTGPGTFKAVRAVSGTQQFYRVKR